MVSRTSYKVEPTSPCSVNACLQLGIEPQELIYIPEEHFLNNLGDKELAAVAFKHHESARQVSHWCMIQTFRLYLYQSG